MRQTMQKIKKTGFLFFPIVILLGMTNCGQFHSFSETDKEKFLSENPVFRNGQGHDPLDESTTCPTGQTLVDGVCQTITCPTGQRLVRNTCEPITCPTGQRLVGNTCQPITTCPSGYRLNSAGTGCERIPPPTRPNTGDGGDGGDGGGGGDGCPLMIDSEGVEYADMNELRNSDDSYLESGELSLTAPADGVKFNLLGQQNTAQLDNGEFLHIQPEAHNFKFQISWTKSDQSRYRWLTLPDASGHVNGIDELFGDNTFGPDSESPFARDGFRALMKWDRGDAVNSDQDFSDDYIDSNDAVFSRLRLWHDLNGDGNCDTSSEISSELVTLDEMGITYIHLMANENFFETDVYGNSITYKSLVGFRASSEEATRLGTAFDIWFRYNPRELISTGYAEIRPNL